MKFNTQPPTSGATIVTMKWHLGSSTATGQSVFVNVAPLRTFSVTIRPAP